MCDASMLCRLTCSRFVAASSTSLATDLGHGASITYHFFSGCTKIVISVARKPSPPTLRAHVLSHGRILSGVSHRGKDGGLIFTAALARMALRLLAPLRVPSICDPGIPPSLPPQTTTMEIIAAVAAFCGLRVVSSTPSGTHATLSRSVAIGFTPRYAVLTTPQCRRQFMLTPHPEPFICSLCYTLFSVLK